MKLSQWFFLSAVLLLLCQTSFSAPGRPQSTGNAHPAYRVVHGWPALPEGYILGEVSGVAVDSHNQVFVFHRGSRKYSAEPNLPFISEPTILCFEGATGRQIRAFGENQFVVPHGLRIDREDNLWLTDVGLHQVFKLSHDGKLLMTLGTARTPGQDGRHFDKPTDVAIGADGTIYVSDGYGNNRVARFSPDGKFLGQWGSNKGDKPGEFNLPHSISIDAEGRVYVADRENRRVQVFDHDGKFLSAWKGDELGKPFAVTIGPDGFAYVVDGSDQKPAPPDHGGVLRLDLSGKVLDRWSRHGNYDGQIYVGHDLAVSKDGAVYVGDIWGRRVQKFVKE